MALNQNGAEWHLYLADTLSLAGRSQEAIAEIEKTLRLNPFSSNEAKFIAGKIYYQAEHYEKAIAIFQNLIIASSTENRGQIWGTWYRFLIASYAASGQLKKARTAVVNHVKEALRPPLPPRQGVERIRVNRSVKNRLVEDLSKAGMSKFSEKNAENN